MTRIEGNFRRTCESVMRVLRENKDSVMAVLEAFVYDPLLNWRLIDGVSVCLSVCLSSNNAIPSVSLSAYFGMWGVWSVCLLISSSLLCIICVCVCVCLSVCHDSLSDIQNPLRLKVMLGGVAECQRAQQQTPVSYNTINVLLLTNIQYRYFS